MRRLALVSVAAVAGLVVPSAAAVAAPAPSEAVASVAAVPESFEFSGSGWGHGLGMSQYGAYGQALEGRSATQILQHYYNPAKVTSTSSNPELRVQVLDTSGTASMSLTQGSWELVYGPDPSHVLPLSGSSLAVSNVSGRVGVTVDGHLYRTSGTMPELYVQWSGTRYKSGSAGLVKVSGANAGTGSVTYRHGRLALRPDGSKVELIAEVLLDGEYLYGLAEMPSSWPSAALEAQAIAGRTYALKAYKASGDREYDLTDETSSQKWTAWNKENETTYGARWDAAADATAGKVLTDGGSLISAFYSSSTGGSTTNSEDVWGGATLDYLRARDDHWALMPAVHNSRAEWTATKTQAQVAALFGLPDVAKLTITERASSGAVMQVRATSSAGDSENLLTTPTTDGVRTRLGLNSAYFSIGSRASVQRLSGDDRYATAVAIARAAYPSSDEVVLVSGQQSSLVDGLVAGPFARSRNAPVLLTEQGGLPDATVAELERRAPSTAWVIGGTGVVHTAVLRELQDMGMTVHRLAGDDRYGTAAAVASKMPATIRAVLVSGAQANLVDAVAAAGPAAAAGHPILLTRPDALPAVTADAIRTLDLPKVYVVGGTGAVSAGIIDQLAKQGVDSWRWSGSDRYATAASVASHYEKLVGSSTVVLAAGTDDHLIDGLTGGALGNLVLLTDPRAVPKATATWFAARDVGLIYVLGGTGAVSPTVVEDVR